MIKKLPEVTPEIVDAAKTYNLEQCCLVCRLEPGVVIEMVEEGIIEPDGSSQTEWTFEYRAITRIQRAHRLQRDLDINLPGVALSVDLLDEIDELRRELERLRNHLKGF